jgi:hypothetical protein
MDKLLANLHRGSAKFDGSTGHITLPTTISTPGTYTITLHFKRLSSNTDDFFMGTYQQVGVNDFKAKLGFQAAMNFFLRNLSGGAKYTPSIGYTSWLDQRWNTLTVTRDSYGYNKVRLNDLTVYTGYLTGDPLWEILGTEHSNGFLHGHLAHVKFWNVEMSDSELQDSLYTTVYDVIPPTLIGWYRLEKDAKDYSGRNNHGVVKGGVTWSDDAPLSMATHKILSEREQHYKYSTRINKGVIVTDDAIPLPTDRNVMSMAVWAKLTTDYNNSQLIVSRYLSNGGTIGAKNVGLLLIVLTNGEIRLDGRNHPDAPYTACGSGRYADGKWHHIVGTVEGNTWKIYIDGVLRNTVITSSPTVDMYYQNVPIRLGVNLHGIGYTGHVINGNLLSASFWNRALTETDISEMMRQPLPVNKTGLMHHYKMSEEPGSTVCYDLNGYHANIQNTGVVTREKDLPYVQELKYMVHRKDDAIRLRYGDYISFSANMVAWNKSTNFTYALWAKFHTETNNFQTTLSTRTDYGYRTGTVLYRFPSGKFGIYFGNSVGGWKSVETTKVLNIGEWYHLALTYDGASILLYVNGLLVSTSAYTTYAATQAPQQLWLGKIHENQFGLEGDLYDVKVFDKVLTRQELHKVYQGETMTNLTGYIRPKQGGGYEDTIGKSETYPYAARTHTAIPVAPVGHNTSMVTNGVDSYARLPAPITAGSAITVEFWCVPAKSTGNSSLFGGVLSGTEIPDVHRCQAHVPWSDDLLYWDYGLGTNPTISRVSLNISQYFGKWTHVALVSSGSGNTFQAIYINGQLAVSKNTSAGLAHNITNFDIGRWVPNTTTTYYQKTKVSNFRVWNTVRTQAQIQASMHTHAKSTDSGLVEQLLLNEGGGTTLFGTKGVNATVYGNMSWSTHSDMNFVGKHGVFPLNSYIALQDTPNLRPLNMTIEGWIYVKDVAPTNHTIISRWGNTTSKRTYFLGVMNGLATCILNIEGVLVTLSAPDTLVMNQWYHIAMTYDGIYMWLYLNGVTSQMHYVEGKSFPDINSITYPSESVPVIGARWGTYDYYANGYIDEVRVWNYAKMPYEVKDEMGRIVSGRDSLMLCYGFESGLRDTSGYGNHGVARNTVTTETTQNTNLYLNAPVKSRK